MNTRTLLTVSSLTLGLAGVVTLFAPTELLAALGAPAVEPLPVLLQLLGALYFAFALANWTAKDSRIGGIYARSLALGNCTHFVIGALTLLKHELAHGFRLPLAAALVGYAVLAVCFGYLVFGRERA